MTTSISRRRTHTFTVAVATIAATALIAVVALTWIGRKTANASESTIVSTQYGQLEGTHVDSDKASDIVEYRGVPYAKPPVGELRWKAPQDPESWSGVRKADTYRSMPMQNLEPDIEPWGSDFYYGDIPQMSEDCLYLNVTTTQSALDGKTKRPVYVWFHGGSLDKAYTNEPEANAAAFAANGIIVVSVEQRLGAFGYLSLKQLSDEQGQSGNYGLMDQIKAMQWIHNNIAPFGGDPSNITIGGQSGGTTKSVAMAASPKLSIPVKGMVLESGLKWTDKYLSQSAAEQRGAAYLQDLGLDPNTSLEQLRSMDAEQLMNTASKNWSGKMTQDNDYITYASAEEAIRAGAFDSINILTGTNYGEGSDHKIVTASDFDSYYRQLLGDLYDEYDFGDLVKVTDQTAAYTARELETYGLGTNGGRNLMVARTFGRMMNKRTNGRQSTYAYVFSHITPQNVADIGTDRSRAANWAWHSSELWYAFDSLDAGTPPARQWTDYDHTLAKQVNAYWSNFIKTGDPNGQSDGTALPEWPKADDSLGYIDLGDGIQGHAKGDSKLEQLLDEYATRAFNLA